MKGPNNTSASSTKERQNPNKSSNYSPYDDVDRGWSFLVLCGNFIAAMLTAMPYCSGLFNLIFLEVFDRNKQTTGWLLAVHGSMLHLTGPLSSYLDTRIGSRWTMILGGIVGALGYFLTSFTSDFTFVFITYGLVAGMGIGIAYVPCVSSVSTYFDIYRSLAYGVVMTGVAVGSVVFPLLISSCTYHYGWRGCMMILSGLQLQLLICGALLQEDKLRKRKKRQTEDQSLDVAVTSSITTTGCTDQTGCHQIYISVETPDKSDHTDDIEDVKDMLTNAEEKAGCSTASIAVQDLDSAQATKLQYNVAHIFLLGSIFCVFVSFTITYVHFPAYFVLQGSTQTSASIYLTIIGVCNIFSRLLGSMATTDKAVSPLLVYLTACGIASILLFHCPILSLTSGGRIAFAVLFGMYSPWYVSMLPLVTIEIVGVGNLSQSWGVQNLVGGIGVLAGPPFAGWLFDTTGTYAHSMYVAGSIYLLGAVVALCIPVVTKRHRSKVTECHVESPVKRTSASYDVSDKAAPEQSKLVSSI